MADPRRNGKVTRAQLDARWQQIDELAHRRARLDPPTRAQRQRAAEVCAEVRLAPTWSPVPLLLGAVVVLLALCLLLAAGCVAPPEAVDQAREQATVEHGHALDEDLPRQARERAADSMRAWRAQHVALTGDDVPGAERWPALPPELGPVEAPAPRCPDGYGEAGEGGHCGCPAAREDCRMPCTTCCPGGCPCGPPTGR